MKKVALWLTAAAVLAAAAVFLLLHRKAAPAPGVPSEPERTERTIPPAEVPARAAVAADPVVNEVPEEMPADQAPAGELASAEYQGPLVKLDSDMILASVNGVAITLKDLMPVNPRVKTERKMTPDMFVFLMDRAIARELTLQAAKDQGLELTAEQKANLDAVRARALERDPRVFSDAQDDYEAKAEYEVRDYAGMMMAETLLAAAGGPPKYVTPEMVRQHYEAHQGDYGELPADQAARDEAWQKIDQEIRGKLAVTLEAEYEKSLQNLAEDLKKRARITRHVEPPAESSASGG